MKIFLTAEPDFKSTYCSSRDYYLDEDKIYSHSLTAMIDKYTSENEEEPIKFVMYFKDGKSLVNGLYQDLLDELETLQELKNIKIEPIWVLNKKYEQDNAFESFACEEIFDSFMKMQKCVPDGSQLYLDATYGDKQTALNMFVTAEFLARTANVQIADMFMGIRKNDENVEVVRQDVLYTLSEIATNMSAENETTRDTIINVLKNKGDYQAIVEKIVNSNTIKLSE